MSKTREWMKGIACTVFGLCACQSLAADGEAAGKDKNAAAPAQQQEEAPADAAAAKAKDTKPAAKAVVLDPLVRVINLRGSCTVKNADLKAPIAAKEGKAYPLSTVYKMGPDASAMLVLSSADVLSLYGGTEVKVDAPADKPASRVITLMNGKIRTGFRENTPAGTFSVVTEDFACKNLSGRAEYTLTHDGVATVVRIGVITDLVVVDGANFTLPELRAANIVEIATEANRAQSRITDVYGDYSIVLENGLETPTTFPMAAKATVKIWRVKAPIGGRDIVTTLAMSPSGTAIHRFAFAKGRADLATGELVTASQEENKDAAQDKQLKGLLEGAAPAAAEKKEEAPAAEEKKDEAPAEKDAAKKAPADASNL